MVEMRIFRNEKDRIVTGYQKRNLSDAQLMKVDEILTLDQYRKETQTSLDNQLALINKLSKEVGEYMKKGDQSGGNKIREEVLRLKEEAKISESSLATVEAKIEDILLQLPNVPHETVPFGKTAEENEVFRYGSIAAKDAAENSLPHWELAKKYQLFDMELGVKITGSGFILYRGQGARLQRALINFFLDEANRAGYEEIQTPLMVNEASGRATGQIPDKEGQMYYVEKDDLYLIPTAEVPVTNIYRDVLLREDQLPIKMCGYTPCFRREAGSYGAHVKGLNRVHQFDKVEIVRIEHPENSYKALHDMLEHVAMLLEKLELPYRILRLCGGDMGFASALTYDFEVYSNAQKRWLEVSSVSNFETFQSNRMKLRFKNENGQSVLAHTLNGSALALARIVAGLLENHQTEDGIHIPKALQAYFGAEKIQ